MTSTVDDIFQENSYRAIQNEYIVEHLFLFLSVNDIKNCRLANRLWRNVGTKMLRRRTHVMFKFSDEELKKFRHRNEETIKKINQMLEVRNYCRENTPENTPISAFAFHGKIDYILLNKFLDEVRSYTRELKIRCAIHNYGKKKMTVDISPNISSHLTKLHIELLCRYPNITITMCFDEISFVKDIYLDKCTIVLGSSGRRLSPSHITLGPKNRYIKNGTKVEFLVNESFDLTLTKQINLSGKNLIVDFSDCANDRVERKTVTLKDITVLNWEKCNWKIKMFYLYGLPFLDKNFIEMERLTMDDVLIDLSKIYNPASLLMLSCGEDTTFADAPFFFPNLVSVALACENCVKKLPYFTNNKYIERMWLGSEYIDELQMSVNINDLPKGICELLLTSIGVHGEGVYPLKILYMEEYSRISKCVTFGAKFRSEIFRIKCENISTDEAMQDVVQLLNLGDSYDRLVIGPFVWEGSNAFTNSVISNYVDREVKYYVFEGERGTGLTEEEAKDEFIDY